MLLRFVVKNLYSFKDETEFYLFPSSRATHHLHHKIQCGDVEAMRLTAIYGANGAGKSNLIKALRDFRFIVKTGSIGYTNFDAYKFRFSKTSQNEPVSMAIEFCHEGIIYYYSLELDTGNVNYELLSISEKNKDVIVFERKSNGTQTINFGERFFPNNKENKLFSSVLQEKLLTKDALLLTFMANNYSETIPVIAKAFYWIHFKLHVLDSSVLKKLALADFFDKNQPMMNLLQDVLTGTHTGIESVSIDLKEIDEDELSPATLKELKDSPGNPITIPSKIDNRIRNSIIYENGKIIAKEIQPIHRQPDGSVVKMPISFESDGTIRLIEYIPLIFMVLKMDSVVIIDEIERSLHPILIKSIISKISESESAKGQLVFTTHESCLLDQDILRPDEIWFVQKDSNQASQFYPLSDFNIHKTANIENGYLNGRYGGIPFLSNLNDLHWQ